MRNYYIHVQSPHKSCLSLSTAPPPVIFYPNALLYFHCRMCHYLKLSSWFISFSSLECKLLGGRNKYSDDFSPLFYSYGKRHWFSNVKWTFSSRNKVILAIMYFFKLLDLVCFYFLKEFWYPYSRDWPITFHPCNVFVFDVLTRLISLEDLKSHILSPLDM